MTTAHAPIRTAALAFALFAFALFALGACDKEDTVIGERVDGRFAVELTGAEQDTSTGTATYRRPSDYINGTRRWTWRPGTRRPRSYSST